MIKITTSARHMTGSNVELDANTFCGPVQAFNKYYFHILNNIQTSTDLV